MAPHSERILVRGVNWLGDAVMSTPALLRLRERFPQAHITLLTPEKLRDLWLHHPAVDEVISFKADDGVWTVRSRIQYDYDGPMKLGEDLRVALDEARRELDRIAQILRTRDWRGVVESAQIQIPERRSFDLALVLPNSPRSALEVWLGRISQRVGYARPWRNWFLTQAVASRPDHVKMRKRTASEVEKLIQPAIARHVSRTTYPPGAHQIHEYLHLVAALGANPEPVPPQLFVTPLELAAVEKKFALDEKSTCGRPLFALHPGAEYGPAKRWPAERFVAAAREIQQRTNCVWLILGSGADKELAARISDGIQHPASNIQPAINLAGKTSLRELMALLKSCQVLLTNDTGPMHVAAALGTPVVVSFGSTSPELTGPGLPGDTRHRLLKSDALCSPCFLRKCPIDFRCMNGISVERVAKEVLSIVL